MAVTILDIDQYQQLLDQLAIPFQDYSLPKQCLLHQLLEKNVLVFTTGPEDYGCTKAIEYPIHTEGTDPIWERHQHILPALCQEVKDLICNTLQSGKSKESRSL